MIRVLRRFNFGRRPLQIIRSVGRFFGLGGCICFASTFQGWPAEPLPRPSKRRTIGEALAVFDQFQAITAKALRVMLASKVLKAKELIDVF